MTPELKIFENLDKFRGDISRFVAKFGGNRLLGSWWKSWWTKVITNYNTWLSAYSNWNKSGAISI